MTVKKEKFDEYNEGLRRAVKGKTYASTAGGYYDDGAGFNWQLYPYSMLYYIYDTFSCCKQDFIWK